MLEPAQGAAAVVQSDAMRKPSPREGIHLQYVVQELDDLVGARPNFGMLTVVRIFRLTN